MLTRNAYAKINWSLNILGRRADHYHELDMLMQTIELHDSLTFDKADTLSLTVNEQPGDFNDLVLRAARALNAHCGTDHGAKITLVKRIPARAGLGGGSADCAAALRALTELWELSISENELFAIGKSLGADVPFCLMGGLARVGGIGEALSPIPNAPKYPMVMVTPGGGLGTPEVFREWDDGGDEVRSVDMGQIADALVSGNLAYAQALSFNALEAPAERLMPEIAVLRKRFIDLGARFARMSGSGSTVFAIFDSIKQAEQVASLIPGAIVTRSL